MKTLTDCVNGVDGCDNAAGFDGTEHCDRIFGNVGQTHGHHIAIGQMELRLEARGQGGAMVA